MIYNNITVAIFIERPNRFIAKVQIDNEIEVVHVKNTGRCKELLYPGVKVFLVKSDNPERKTRYDLVAVYKENTGIINIDSQAPNVVVSEWLNNQSFSTVKPEYSYGKSRIDFYAEKGKDKYLIEVKGCTLEKDGRGYFPDAPTERGVKHLNELIRAKKEGYQCMLIFVIQINNVVEVFPNDEIHKEFGETLREAKKCGVTIKFLKCHVEEAGIYAID